MQYNPILHKPILFFFKKEKESRAHHKKSEQFLLGTTLAIASFPSEKAANKFFLLNKSCPVYIKTYESFPLCTIEYRKNALASAFCVLATNI